MKDRTLDWIVIVRQVCGGENTWQTECYWDGVRHPSRQAAISAGGKTLGHDDFNIGELDGDRLVWFGWMDHEIAADRAETARRLYLHA